MPAAQAPHASADVDASVGEAVPRGHSSHAAAEAAPVEFEYEPAGQAAQDKALGAAKVPGAHAPHATSVVLVPNAVGTLPAEHTVKFLHDAADALAAKRPAPQGAQAAPSGDANPGEQGTHNALAVAEQAGAGAAPATHIAHALQAGDETLTEKLAPETHGVQTSGGMAPMSAAAATAAAGGDCEKPAEQPHTASVVDVHVAIVV